jgi:hypothetical protein
MDFDPLILSRIQFAFTISFHIRFPDPDHPRLYRLQHLGVRGKVTLDAGYH